MWEFSVPWLPWRANSENLAVGTPRTELASNQERQENLEISPGGYWRSWEPQSYTETGSGQLPQFSIVGLLQQTGGPWTWNPLEKVPSNFDFCVTLISAITHPVMAMSVLRKGWADVVQMRVQLAANYLKQAQPKSRPMPEKDDIFTDNCLISWAHRRARLG